MFILISVFLFAALLPVKSYSDEMAFGRLINTNKSLTFEGRRFDEKNVDRALLFGPHLHFGGELYLANKQSFHFKVEAVHEMGTSQSRFGENLPSNGLTANHAYYSYAKSFRHIIDVGLINQSWINNELLFSDQAFPAIRLNYSRNLGPIKRNGLSDIYFQISMPTSSEIKTRTTENETEPYSLVFGPKFHYENLSWLINASVFYYNIASLPSEIALESANFGNRVDTSGAPRASFENKFEGIAGSLSIKKDFYTYSADLKYSFINNTRESNNSKGQIVEFGLRKKQHRLALLSFFNESDTSVASYNSYKLGHNNRKGSGISYKIDFNNSSQLEASMIQTKQIEETFLRDKTIYQSIRKTWLF